MQIIIFKELIFLLIIMYKIAQIVQQNKPRIGAIIMGSYV